MSSPTLCQICKEEEFSIETPIPKCTRPEGSKHRINVCTDCYTQVKKMECPQCLTEKKPLPEEIKAEPKAVKPVESEEERILAAVADRSRCFLCKDDETIIMMIVKSCKTRDHEIPCCAACVKKLSNEPCPLCKALKVESKRDQHIMIFYEDIVVVGMLLAGYRKPSWTLVASVEAISGLNFLEFPQQGACVSLDYHPYHVMYIGGYASSQLEGQKEKYASALVVPNCYFMLFSGFDYLTLDAAPELKEARFLHQAVGYYDKGLNRNLVYAIGGIQYNKNKKVWLRSCEVWGLTTDRKWEPGPSLNSARSEFSAGISGRLLYVIGGFSGPNKFVAHDIEICEIGGSWQPLKVETPMGYRTLVSQTTCTDNGGDTIWIFGGADGKRVYKHSYMLSLKEKKIIERCPMTYPRGAAISAYHEGRIFVTCGYGSQMQTEVYNIKKDEWEVTEESYESIAPLLEEGNAAANSEHVMSAKLAIMQKFI